MTSTVNVAATEFNSAANWEDFLKRINPLLTGADFKSVDIQIVDIQFHPT